MVEGLLWVAVGGRRVRLEASLRILEVRRREAVEGCWEGGWWVDILGRVSGIGGGGGEIGRRGTNLIIVCGADMLFVLGVMLEMKSAVLLCA